MKKVFQIRKAVASCTQTALAIRCLASYLAYFRIDVRGLAGPNTRFLPFVFRFLADDARLGGLSYLALPRCRFVREWRLL